MESSGYEVRTLTDLLTGTVHVLKNGPTLLGANPATADIVLLNKTMGSALNDPASEHAVIIGHSLNDKADVKSRSWKGTWTHVFNRSNPKLPSRWYRMAEGATKVLEHGEELCFGGDDDRLDVVFKTPDAYNPRFKTNAWQVFRYEVSYPNSTDTCAICMESIKVPAVLNCGHRFCSTCIGPWAASKKPEDVEFCPTCRSPSSLEE
jgi:hypothetical protein